MGILLLFASYGTSFAGTKLLPVLNLPIVDRSALAGSPFTVDMTSAFGTEAIDDNVVRFTSQFNSGNAAVVLDMALFSNRTPATRQNFLNYVSRGDYVNSFIHRSVPGFVIQGGGFRVFSNGIGYVSTVAPIVNEFGISNTLGTISMAKLGGDPNSATSQWFVSLGQNSDILDPQNGGFTVFARVTKSTLGNAQVFGNPGVFPIFNKGGSFAELPLWNTHNPSLAFNIYDFIFFPEVSVVPLPAGEAGEDPTLSYSLVSNSNPTIVTATMQSSGILEITPVAGQTGSSVFTVNATDSVGNQVQDTFTVTVNLTDTYTTWASRSSFSGGQTEMTSNPDSDAWNNLQEFAFLGNPSQADSTGTTISYGVSGGSPSYLTITFPVRKATQGLTYTVEGCSDLSGLWTEVWKSADGFAHAQVVSATDQADRTVITIKDTVSSDVQSKRFLRIRTVQE